MTTEDPTRVEVLPVPEGSIVWLHNADFDPATMEGTLDALKLAVGHDRFCVLFTQDGALVEVLGPDELVAKVRAALDTETP